MKNIILEILPTYLMVLLVGLTLATSFSVGLLTMYYIGWICLYLVVSVTLIFTGVALVKYMKEVKTK